MTHHIHDLIYAITPAIVNSFRHALSIVDSALSTGRSQAAYLHRSFGSGKSHFMAILDLLLANQSAPWKRGELHELRTAIEVRILTVCDIYDALTAAARPYRSALQREEALEKLPLDCEAGSVDADVVDMFRYVLAAD